MMQLVNIFFYGVEALVVPSFTGKSLVQLVEMMRVKEIARKWVTMID